MTFRDGNLVQSEDSWHGRPSSVLASEIAHPDLRRLYSIWDEARGSGRFPAPGVITPRQMLFMLERIALVEIKREPLRFFWRVVGGWWRDHFGFEGTGKYVDEWPSEPQRNMLLESYGVIVATEGPCRHLRNQIVDGQTLIYEAILLPLGSDDKLSSFIVGVTPQPERLAFTS